MSGCDEVAVKRARGGAPTAADLALFAKEVSVLRSLRHRNVVQASAGRAVRAGGSRQAAD